MHQLKFDIKKTKDEIENLQDAASMVEEAMGDPIKLFIGDALVDVDEEAGTNYVEKLIDEKQELLDKQTDELDAVDEDLKGLKSFLYARFGQSINLEENK